MILIYNQCFRSTSEHPKLLFISHFLVFSGIFAEMRVFLGWNDMFDRVRGAKIRFLFHLTFSDTRNHLMRIAGKLGQMMTKYGMKELA